MKILITYDFLSTNNTLGKSLSSKFIFLKEILEELGLEVVIDDNNYKFFSAEKLYELEKIKNVDETFNILDFKNLTSQSKEYINSYIKGFDFLITYELTKETREYFDLIKIKYLDFWMSPIRFYKDIMFSFFSNEETIQKKLEKYEIEKEKLIVAVEELKSYCNYLKKDNITLEDNSALIIGQVFKDKALLKDGSFLNLLDFKKEIKQLSTEYQKLYFLKHPLIDVNDFKTILNGFNDIKNIEYLSECNIYSLLSKKEVKKVVAISSSVLQESVYFNKEIQYLYKPVLGEKYINIFDAFYKSEFWIDILKINSNKHFKFLTNDNFLRYKFNAFYAYKYFNSDDLLKHNYSAIVSLYEFCKNIKKNKDYILYGYGSVGKIVGSLLKNNIKGIVDNSLNKKDINTVDDFKVIDISEINSSDSVIITPFLYTKEIKIKLKNCRCEIIEIKV